MPWFLCKPNANHGKESSISHNRRVLSVDANVYLKVYSYVAFWVNFRSSLSFRITRFFSAIQRCSESLGGSCRCPVCARNIRVVQDTVPRGRDQLACHATPRLDRFTYKIKFVCCALYIGCPWIKWLVLSCHARPLLERTVACLSHGEPLSTLCESTLHKCCVCMQRVWHRQSTNGAGREGLITSAVVVSILFLKASDANDVETHNLDQNCPLWCKRGLHFPCEGSRPELTYQT